MEWEPRFPRSVALVLAAGMALRTVLWLHGIPIRLDEARVALNLMDRSYLELLRPLAYHQAEPWGLLLVQKGLGELLGYGERILRLPSLIAALASLPLFDAVVRRYLDGRGRIAADAMLAFALFPFLSAGYGKQYAAAAFVTLALWWAALTWRATGRRFFLLALISLPFSFPAVFVAGGIYVVVGVRRPGRRLFARAAGFAAAAVVMAVALFDTTSDPYLQQYWHEHMLATAEAPISWIIRHVVLFFENPAPVGAPTLAGGIALFGAWLLHQEHGARAWLLFGAIPLLVVASALGLWPLADRLLFFLVPLAFLCMALPIGRLCEPGMRGLVATALLAVLLLPGAREVLNQSFRGPMRWDVRTVTDRFLERYRPGDAVYVYLNAEPPFAYYLRRRDRTIAYTIVRPEPDRARQAFASAPTDRRVWWITSGEGPPSEREQLRRMAAERTGGRIARLGATGADAYLYAPVGDWMPRSDDAEGTGTGGAP